MESFNQYIPEYRKQLEKGTVKAAYQGLMRYFDSLRLHLKNSQPDYFISDVHYGLMDYTYFYFFPKTLQRMKIKVVILFSHDTFTIEVLLAGYNRETQTKYWKLFKEKGYCKYHLSKDETEADRFLSHIIDNQPDFSNPDELTSQIEAATLQFIDDIEAFLEKYR